MTDQLPQYRCHKLVRAAKVHHRRTSGTLVLDGGHEIDLTAQEHENLAKRLDAMMPQQLSGGYYVLYDDGYESWSPAQAFEDGYRLVRADPMADAILTFQDMGAAAYAAAWPCDPHHDRLRRIARRMAEKDGHDPDMMVMGAGGQVLAKGPNNSIMLRFPIVPIWASYLDRVDSVLTVLNEGYDQPPARIDRQTRTCSACQGGGNVSTNGSMAPCRACDGTGRVAV